MQSSMITCTLKPALSDALGNTETQHLLMLTILSTKAVE